MEVCEASLYAGLQQVKPGNRLSDISHAIQVYLEDHGCTTPLDYTGHGIGSEVHEDPAVPNYGKKCECNAYGFYQKREQGFLLHFLTLL